MYLEKMLFFFRSEMIDWFEGLFILREELLKITMRTIIHIFRVTFDVINSNYKHEYGDDYTPH